ncbi:MAG: CPBP family intramembrane glutamic endopeptidase [Candidatus Ornithomonoglobus sp.]
MEKYIYRPVRFYVTVFACTWFWWLFAIFFNRETYLYLGMFLGLISPAVIAIITVFTSKNKALVRDFKRKIIGFYRIKPLYICAAILLFALVVAASIGTSVLFGGSADQFSFTEDFSFSIGGSSALLTILLASIIEELGWRGYGEDAVGAYHSWFKESVIFGFIWASWHIPLFWVPGTYHHGLREMGIVYVLNFLISVIPLNFLQTWVYVKNNRSMLATIIFHLFINVMQEKINMTPETKCIETVFVVMAAIIIVITNKEMFFETKHIGNLLEEQH